uniref:Proto-oncogene tyrosine-protein kinase receptor Ret n=1 Tax=Ascaris suum TaxID=6253 RepID=F1KW71_ASCSU
MLILWFILCDYIFATNIQIRRTDCTIKCDHFEENIAFETCLKICAGTAAHTPHRLDDNDSIIGRSYPLPPSNLTVETSAIIGDVKFLESTIYWDAEPDDQRIGFYLRVTAVEEWCERDFPGYYEPNIGPTERSHTIPPLTTDSQPLEIQHDCTYDILMHSRPYPYGEAEFAAVYKYTVPTCVEGYCSCRSQDAVPEPRNLIVTPFMENGVIKVMLNWTYPAIAGHTHQFRFDLSERFYHNQIRFKDSDAFKFHISDMPSHVVFAQENETSFWTVLPMNFRVNEEYRVTIFSMNDQLCNSREVTIPFTTTFNDQETTTSTELPIVATSLDDDHSLNINIDNSPNTTSSIIAMTPSEILNVTIIGEDSGQQNDESPSMRPSEVALKTPILMLLVGSATLMATLLTCCILICTIRNCFKRSAKSHIEKSSIIPWSMAHSSHSMLETNILYRRAIAPTTSVDYEIPFSRIQVGGIIGQGAFGLVCMGTAHGVEGYAGPTTVAIKQLRANAEESERMEFIAEMNIMKQVGRHPNIVAMYGCCTEPNHQCMVMEYVPFGDLKHYLQNLRKQLDLAVLNIKTSMHCGQEQPICPSLPPSLHSSFVSAVEDPSPSAGLYHLDPTELQSFAIQVANGMAHIESLGIIHRDLAARNILVGGGNQLKISDFGLSRHGVYVKASKGVIPLRWLSIEAIQHSVYSTKSDVWAYGVVLWEICTLGGFPYSTVSDKDLLKYLQQGNRLEKPTSCANEIYDVMMQCWAHNASDRPSFAYLCDHLSDLNNQQYPYVEFVPNDELPPPDGYCELADNPATHTFPSAIGLSIGEVSPSAIALQVV